MKRKELKILSPDRSTEVNLGADGIIMIKGRGFLPGNNEIVDRISEWVDDYIKDPEDVTQVILAFEYLNSPTTMTLITMLKKLIGLLSQNKKLKIRWYHEEGDHDIIERGEHISSVVNFPFEFIMTRNISR